MDDTRITAQKQYAQMHVPNPVNVERQNGSVGDATTLYVSETRVDAARPLRVVHP